MTRSLKIVILGLSITSSWGNGHATTYRALAKGLIARGHKVLFLERDVPWYSQNRDLHQLPGCDIQLYSSLHDLERRFTMQVRHADFVMIGSYVPEGINVCNWMLATASGVTAFYDIDTPITIAQLDRSPHISRELIPRFQLYLSFTGGPMLKRIEFEFGARRTRALYCSADAESYQPKEKMPSWDLAYLGTYSADRQGLLEQFLIEPASRWSEGKFMVAGAQYPLGISWAANVQRIDHLAPCQHRDFYTQQRFTLNITRKEMRIAGYSPSIRLFEAAACGTPIITDSWPGLEQFFKPGKEVFVVKTTEDVLKLLTQMPESERKEVSEAARKRFLSNHTGAHRAAELEQYILELAR